jgi:hypothetical protein
MWKLVKTEIEYFKWLYIISLIVVIIINIGLTIDNKWIEAQNDFPGIRVIWMGVGIVVLFFALLFNRKSGRLRTKILLPLSHFKFAFARLSAFLIFWGILFVILLLFYIYNFRHFPTFSWLINFASITGLIFLINSIPVLYSDFYSTYFKKSEKFIIGAFWGILWIIYVWMNVIFMTYLDFISPEYFAETRETLKELYFTPATTITNIIVGFSMFFLSILTFRKRKLYLE